MIPKELEKDIPEMTHAFLFGEFFSIKVVKNLHFDVNKHAISNKSHKVRIILFT